MGLLARRNLFHDKVRLTVTLTGIVFALVLIVVQFGLFLGFTTTTSNNIDHSGVDAWVVSHGVRYFDTGKPFSERKYFQVLGTPGVAHAEKYVQAFAVWKRADGRTDNIQIIGFNPDTGVGGPWNIVEGKIADLKQDDAVMIDEIYKQKLGVEKIGDRVEITGHRARVVGFTQGIRSFTTSPFVYTSFKNTLNYPSGRMNQDQTTYILVSAEPGVTPQELKRRLESCSRCGRLHHERIQPLDAFLLDVHHRRGTGSADRGGDGIDCGRGGGDADNLCNNDGSFEGVRHSESHGRVERIFVPRDYRAGGDQRGSRVRAGDDCEPICGASLKQGRRSDSAAAVVWSGDVFSGGGDVHRGRVCFHQQIDETGSGDGL